ncbi:MAG: ribosome small subunit-dependent GTPase A [Saprospiraceae bacterium]|nr:ribosome small subunit-dependent GTPase A [Saprospiraceae bacterium]
MKGIVTKSTGKWYIVKLEDERLIRCRIKGKFRLGKLKLTNPIAVGDLVFVNLEKGLETGMISKLYPRSNYVLRQSTRRKHFMHLIAANIDQAFIIVTIREPMLKPGFIDRFLLSTESHNIPTYIIVNKADIYSEDDMNIQKGLASLYEEVGYKTILVSALDGEGIENLKSLLKDKTTLLSGHSGVGKSSLINAIQNGLEIETRQVSEYSGKGIHTTTFSQMYELDNGGNIIDTPGIKEMGFINMNPMDVAHNFREIFDRSEHCKYGNCMHINEPQCAVKESVESGSINILRYQSYLSILEDIMEQNSWERETDW